MPGSRFCLTDNIDTYMNDIRRYAQIDVAEENRLSELVRNGTPDVATEARNALVVANLRLVVKIAHDFKRYGVPFSDLVAEGNTGLMIAANKFNPGKGAKFSCYASWWIKQSMRKAIYWQSRIIRVPSGTAQRLVNVAKVRDAFITRNGYEPTSDDIADNSRYTKAQIDALDGIATDTVSLNEVVSDDSGTTFDSIVSERYEDESIYRTENILTVQDLLHMLSDMDRFIISHLYGIGCEQLNERQLSQEVGIAAGALQERVDDIMSFMRRSVRR